MGNVLDEILERKRAYVSACRATTPISALDAVARRMPPTRGFIRALRGAVAAGRYGLIAEIKKASPSKGLIRADFDPPSLAVAYRDGGATCLSVLTDTPYFQGADAHLLAARSKVDLPIIRKDFIIDPYQVVEARTLGADAILLIMAALDDGLAAEIEQTAISHSLDVLIEVHNGEELDRALKLKSPLIGVNNRNLKTLSVDLATTEQLAARLPADRLGVSESGLNSPADLARMARIGVRCFLIGESLMRQRDVAAATSRLLALAS